MRAVLAAPTLSAHERLVLICLLAHADQGYAAWPSRATIASRTALSASSVARALADLEARGAIASTTRNGDTGRQTSSRRVVDIARISAPISTVGVSGRHGPHVRETRGPCQGDTQIRSVDQPTGISPSQNATTGRSSVGLPPLRGGPGGNLVEVVAAVLDDLEVEHWSSPDAPDPGDDLFARARWSTWLRRSPRESPQRWDVAARVVHRIWPGRRAWRGREPGERPTRRGLRVAHCIDLLAQQAQQREPT